MEYFKINNEKIHENFHNHLKIKDNKRILLSGRFGIGKTYFIHEFFKKHEEYEPTFITPVNYQVAKNEDVFELIKYDIILEFISKDIIDTEEVKVNELLSMQFYIQNSSSDLTLDLLSLIPKLGKTTQLIKSLKNFIEDYKKYSQQLKKSELDIVSRYAKMIENTKGSIYESDFLTELIFELQNRIRAKKKNSILVIDDIDRIEPEHIFRILNIFSSHYTFDELTEEDNKFNFDQIVLICDIENIRKIFHAKYGQEVDFSGYIDKFYSTNCFHFNNTSSILNSLDNIFDSVNINKSTVGIVRMIKYVLTDFIKANSVNLRDLQNVPFLEQQLQNNRRFEVTPRFRFTESEIPLVKALFVLRKILGNDDLKVISCFKMCQNKLKDSVIRNKIEFIKNVVPFINIEKTNFEIDSNQTTEIKDLGIEIEFQINNDHDFHLGEQYLTEINRTSRNQPPLKDIVNLTINEFYFILEKVYKNINNLTQEE